jgi:hypothetical protein
LFLYFLLFVDMVAVRTALLAGHCCWVDVAASSILSLLKFYWHHCRVNVMLVHSHWINIDAASMSYFGWNFCWVDIVVSFSWHCHWLIVVCQHCWLINGIARLKCHQDSSSAGLGSTMSFICFYYSWIDVIIFINLLSTTAIGHFSSC